MCHVPLLMLFIASRCIASDLHRARAAIWQREGFFQVPGMAAPGIDDPETNPPWVLNPKSRMPRHADPEDPEWFLSQHEEPWKRWLEAEQSMLEHRVQGNWMKMQDAFEKIRRDICRARVAGQPQQWTTMVLGRPVQAK